MSATRTMPLPQKPTRVLVLPRPQMQPQATPQWQTPDQLKAAIAAVAVACLLLMLAVMAGARSHRGAMQSVGKDSVPSIIAAHHIASALADMDRNAADELLTKQSNKEAARAFEARRTEAVFALVTASENITYGDAERLPIQRLAQGIGTYEAQVQQALDLQTAGDKRFLDAFRSATRTMDTALLPAAADLERANGQALDRIYAQHQASSSGSTILVTISAMLVGGILLWLQMFLARHMRRIFNPLLIAATSATLLFWVHTTNAFQAEDRELRIAKQDAFQSIHALWQARASAYSANADESRYLLDSSEADAHRRAFLIKADRIAHLPGNIAYPDVESALRTRQKVSGLSGFLADELNNITFPGESEPALETLSRFQAYLAIDRQVRKLEQSGQHQAAIALCLGNAAGQPDSVFARFDDALGRTLDINKQAFDGAVKRGFDEVAGFEILAPIGSLTITLLALFGLLPRIREYSA